jgi:hypothetical protein
MCIGCLALFSTRRESRKPTPPDEATEGEGKATTNFAKDCRQRSVTSVDAQQISTGKDNSGFLNTGLNQHISMGYAAWTYGVSLQYDCPEGQGGLS